MRLPQPQAQSRRFWFSSLVHSERRKVSIGKMTSLRRRAGGSKDPGFGGPGGPRLIRLYIPPVTIFFSVIMVHQTRRDQQINYLWMCSHN